MASDRERISRILEGFDPVAYGLPEDFILTKLTAMKGCGCKVPRAILLDLLKTFDSDIVIDSDGVGIGLDSCVVPLRHKGLNLVQTTDFFYPLVDDPYLMGRVTCANVLSDLYAMGIVDCDNMLMLLGVAVDLNEKERDIIISMFIKGFKDTADSAGTKVRGGQTVRCPWLLLGGVASSVAADEEIIRVDQAKPGDVLVLTKPIGGQVAVNSYEWLKKKNGRVEELGLDEGKIIRAFQQVTEQMTRLNRNAARMLHNYHAHASTDVTGFGLLGHADNLSRAQKANVRFVIDTLPVIEYMDEIALKMPNRNGFNLFGGTSAETSGGLLVALSPENAEPFIRDMESFDGFPAWVVGHVEALDGKENHAIIHEHYRVVSVPSKIHD
uniref:Selenide, water dikinase n=1 Tax=Haemonchus contortus TaxID=6289 RepID=A0A7I5EAJ1_HAECO